MVGGLHIRSKFIVRNTSFSPNYSPCRPVKSALRSVRHVLAYPCVISLVADRGGTFTDVHCSQAGKPDIVLKVRYSPMYWRDVTLEHRCLASLCRPQQLS